MLEPQTKETSDWYGPESRAPYLAYIIAGRLYTQY